MGKPLIITAGVTGIALIAGIAFAQTMDHGDMAMGEEAIEGAVHTKAMVNSMGDARSMLATALSRKLAGPR